MHEKEIKKSILESENFERDVEDLRSLAAKIKKYTEQEERERWQQQMSLENS